MKSITFCICGGGSLGHVMAGVISSQGYTVNVLTNHPEKWNQSILIYDINQKILDGNLQKISNLPSECIPDADIVLICLPGYLINEKLQQIKKYLKSTAIVGSIVSNTGFFIMANHVLGDDYNLFGFQRVPFIARTNEYGKSAFLLGRKKSLKMAFSRKNDSQKYLTLFSNLLDTPISLLGHILEATLTNSNPILHPARLYNLFHNWDSKYVYDKEFLFYEEWTDESSDILINCDKEFQNIISKLPIDNSEIPSLLEYYESEDKYALTKKIKSIEAFKNIKAPMIKKDNGYIPDLNSRYFTEDIPYGLLLIKYIGIVTSTSTLNIDKILCWSQDILHKTFLEGNIVCNECLNEIACLNKAELDKIIFMEIK